MTKAGQGDQRPKKALVTGCAGFIGWKVSEFLLKRGYSVVGIDNLNDVYDITLKRWRLSQLESHRDFEFHQIDIIDRPALDRLFTQCRVSESRNFGAVINLAALAGVRQSLGNPWAYYQTNVQGTLNLLELCRTNEVQKFILSSTSSVYGKAESPFREDSRTDLPLSPYAASKRAAEVLAFTYHHLYDVESTVLRYFTVYGPGGRPDMSIFRFVRWITDGEPLILFGDGSQSRGFTYIDDIVKGTALALNTDGYEVINLGSERPTTLCRIILLLEEILGRKAQIEHHPLHPADPPTTSADISKARKLLGWSPEFTIEVGLQHTADWYRNNREWARKIHLS